MADTHEINEKKEARYLLLGLFEYSSGLIMGLIATILALIWAWIEFEEDRE